MNIFYRYTIKTRTLRKSVILSFSALLLFGGLFCALYHFHLSSGNLTFSLRAMILPSSILLPCLVLSNKRDFDASLSSLPVSSLAIVLSRTLASVTLFLLSSAPFALSPLICRLFGGVDLGASYRSLLFYLLHGFGILFFCEGLALLVRKKQLRYLLGFGLPIGLYLLSYLLDLLPLPDAWHKIFSLINPTAAFFSLCQGGIEPCFALTLVLPIGLGLSLSLLGVFLEGRGSENRHLRRKITLKMLLAAALSLTLLVASCFLPTIHTTDRSVFLISGASRDALRELDADVSIYYLVEGGARNADADRLFFLEQYEKENEHIRLTVVDTKQDADFSKQFSDETLSDHSLIVVSGDHFRVLSGTSLYHYYNGYIDRHLSADYYAYCLSAYENALLSESTEELDLYAYYGQLLYLYSEKTIAYFDGDAMVTNAILYVTDPSVPVIYVKSGSDTALDQTLVSYLSANGYRIRTLASLSGIPSDCNLLLVHSPSEDLTDRERDTLLSYLSLGGKVFLSTSYAYEKWDNLSRVTEFMGLSRPDEKHTICQKNTSGDSFEDIYFARLSSHAATGNFDGSFSMIMPHAISSLELPDVQTHAWITTLPTACLKYPDGSMEEQTDTYTVGAIGERGDGALIWIGSALSMGLGGYQESEGGNYALLLSAFDELTDRTFRALSIDSIPVPTYHPSLPKALVLSLSCLFVLLLPSFVAVGLWSRRKKRG